MSNVSQVPASEQSVGRELRQAVVFFLQPLLIVKVTTHLVMGRLGSLPQPLYLGSIPVRMTT